MVISGHKHAAQKRKLRRLLIYILAVVTAAVSILICWLFIWNEKSEEQQRAYTQTAAPANAKTNGRVEARVLFVGDTFWGRAVNKWAQESALKEKQPFSRLHEFGRGQYDAWVANLECPAAPGVDQPYQLEKEQLLFNCPVRYLPEAAKWFTAVSLANNHTANQGGQPGLQATRESLAAHGIQYFGHYDPTLLSDICEVVSMPARLEQNNQATKRVTIPFALCGYHGLPSAPSNAALAVMRQYSSYMPVVAYPHMGTEYMATSDTVRQNLYRAMVHNGADAVLGSHPHWVQPAEVYKGKLIVYSMGNFMFDQNPGETQRGVAIDLALTAESTTAADFQKMQNWLDIANTCATFRDTCLVQLRQQNLRRPSLSFVYRAHGVDMSKRVTHPATGGLEQQILQRLDWPTIQQSLSDAQHTE